MHRPARLKPRGLSLADTMVGLFVLLVVVLGLINCLAPAIGMNRRAQEMTVANGFTQQRIEQVVAEAGNPNRFAALVTRPFTLYTEDASFGYLQTVKELEPGLIRITIATYYARSDVFPPAIDTSKPGRGLIDKLTVTVHRP